MSDVSLLEKAEAARANGSFEQAAEYCAELLQDTPDHPGALALVELLCADGVSNPAALDPLARSLAQKEAYARAARVVDKMLESLEETIERRFALRRAGQLWSLAQKPDLAFERILQILQENPNDAETMAGLLKMADGANTLDLLALELGRNAEQTNHPTLARRLSRSALGLMPRLTKVEQARALFDSLAQISPVEATETFESWLDAALDREPTSVEESAILVQIAQLKNGRGDSEEALRLVRKAMELTPGNAEARQELRQLLETTEAYNELAELFIEDALEATETQVKIDAFETASIYLEHQNSPERAFEILAKAFCTYPDLERFAENLERLANETGKIPELIEYYQTAANTPAEDGRDPQALLRRVVALTLEQNDLPAAAQAQFDLCALDHSSEASAFLDELLLHQTVTYPEENSEVANKNQEIINLFKRRLDEPLELVVRRTLVRNLIGICERLNRIEEALDLGRALLDLSEDPEDLSQLTELCEEHGEYQDLVELLQRAIAAEENPAKKLEILLHQGAVYREHLNDADSAILAFQSAWELDRADSRAFQALDELYTHQANWDALLDLLNDALCSEPESRTALQKRVAIVQEKGQGDFAAAIDTWRELLADNPNDDEACFALADLLEREARYDDLADLCQAQLKLTKPGTKADRLQSILVEVFSGPLDAPERALQVLEPLIPTTHDRQLLAFCANLAESRGNDILCAQALIAQANLVPDDEKNARVEMRRQAVHCFQKMDQLSQAEPAILAILNDIPDDVEALDLVSQLYSMGQGSGDLAAKLAEQARQLDDPMDRTERLTQAGNLAKNRGQTENAIQYWREALQTTSTHLPALRGLSQVEPPDEAITTTLTALRLETDPLEHLTLTERLAALDLQQPGHVPDEALAQALQRAQANFPADRTLQLYQSDLLARRGDLEEAALIDQALIEEAQNDHSIVKEDLVRLAIRLAEFKQAQGDIETAHWACNQALAAEPDAKEVLVKLAEILETKREYDGLLDVLLHLAAQSSPAEESIYEERAGDLLQNELGRPEDAAEVYRAASRQRGEDLSLLEKRLAAEEASSQWEAATETLQMLAALDPLPEQSARRLFHKGEIERDQLNRPEQALKTFDHVLDVDPGLLRSFKAQLGLIAERGDTDAERAAYERMVNRAITQNLTQKTITALANNLGELYRAAGNFEKAKQTFELSLNHNPKNTDTLRLLARLEIERDELDNAIDCHRSVLELDWQNAESLRAIKHLFTETDRLDAAWCTARALCALQLADESERAFYENFRPTTLPRFARPLSSEDWALIQPPAHSPLVQRFYREVAPSALSVFALQHKAFGINKRRDLFEANAETTVGRIISHVTWALEAPQCECFLTDDHPGISLAITNPPALLIERDLMADQSPRQVAFLCARNLYLAASENALANLDDSTEERRNRLRTVVCTTRQVMQPNLQLPEAYIDANLRKSLRRLPDAQLQTIALLLTKMEMEPERNNTEHWLRSMDAIANRLALLFCDDLELACRLVQRDDLQLSSADSADRVRDLFLFSISAPYLNLRTRLGLTATVG